jgi:hypothetical protein
MAMMLPQKSTMLTPVATTDISWNAQAADPTITAIPQGSSFGQAPATSRETYSAQQDQSKMLASSGGAMHGGAEVLVANTNTDWMNTKWRPAMGWVYLIVCLCDFVIFPILWSILQAMSAGQVTSQWGPLSIQGGGLFHIAMGAVIGVAAYGRTQEKLAEKQ